MNNENWPAIWRRVKEAAEALNTPFSNGDIRKWVVQKYPGTKDTAINTEITALTVNLQARVYYSYSNSPRIANGEYDVLFNIRRGQFERYDPKKHGQWEVYRNEEEDVLGVRKIGELDPPMPVPTGNGEFAEEKHLRSYLVRNLESIEPGLKLFTDDSNRPGVEYSTGVGFIDILALDKNDDFVVLELKLSKGPDAVSGQIMRYINWVRMHMAKDKQVRGIIIAKKIPPTVKYALADRSDVSYREYDLQFSLKEVERVEMVQADNEL